MNDVKAFSQRVFECVPGYRRFLATRAASIEGPFAELPLQTKQNYLLEYPMEELCWNGSLGNCHLIGSSSGFSKSGSVFWPKRPEDEKQYLEALEQMLVQNYGIDRDRTLIICCMALGTWFGGMTITAALRVIAAGGRLPITICTPGLNLAEAVEIYSRFQTNFTKVLWITNPSNISLITSLIARKGINVPPGSCYFPVVGEYFSETFRESVAGRYGHAAREPFVVWTGYGSADTGDIAVETAATIRLRKFFHKNQELRRQLFGSDDTPMLLALAPKAHVEILDGRIVVTKDQLVPLVRYNTGDEGGILEKEELGRGGTVPDDILNELPERILFVRGRASNSIIFYGTNLNVQEINQHFLELPRDMSYSGLYTVRKVEQGDVTLFEFTVFVESLGDGALAERYHASLLGYLKGRSLEFEAKYSNLTRSLGEELIRVAVEELAGSTGAIKHRFIID
ncbi:MAG: phenylacetate--CoA ligase [Deltaproteobacteria bacterium]|nr:phenylacetate--CoA ligase [Deltaproteobacteria bacterium]TLN02879.1 MAG: phenylacetate--CoA ligase [bacterium]